MALVSYSDSEVSDLDQECIGKIPKSKKPTCSQAMNQQNPADSTDLQPTIDHVNPRKIRISLPEAKSEQSSSEDCQGDEPARKKLRIAGGRGSPSGFNAMLPAPKRTVIATGENKAAVIERKMFTLKTSAEPGFSREANEEIREKLANETILKTRDTQTSLPELPAQWTDGEVREEPALKGSAMVFKPLSVARNLKSKKRPMAAAAHPPREALPGDSTQLLQDRHTIAENFVSQPKPKVSLFSLRTDEKPVQTPNENTVATSTGYQPLVYHTSPNISTEGPEQLAEETVSAPTTSSAGPALTLDSIADDLNLSRSERRQLLGRHDASSKSKVLHFNTDSEYMANQQMAANADIASQHNPVRAIAPGKHTLQQLVNAASTQREALEESFAAGRRNKKEAGAKYGW